MAIRTIFSCLSTLFKNYKLYIVGYWIIGVGWLINPFMHNVVKWPNILWKSCGVNTAGFLKYIWPFYNIMHERVKKLSLMIKKWQTTHVKHVKEFYETLFIKREQKLIEMKWKIFSALLIFQNSLKIKRNFVKKF